MRLVATTVVRESIRGKQKTGFIYDVSWDDRRFQRLPVPEPRFPESVDNPRGGVRGGRGVAVTRRGIIVANDDTLVRYDDGWNVLETLNHPLLVGVHEIDWDGEHVWAAATGIDAVLRVTLDGTVAVRWDPHRSELAARFGLRERRHPIDGSIDYGMRQAPRLDDWHINAVTRRGPDLIVNCGLVRRRRALPVRIAKRALRMVGRRRPFAADSLVVKVDGDGGVDVLVELGDHDVPTHNGQLVDDSRLVLNDSSQNSVRVFELGEDHDHRSIEVPGTWLRGLQPLDRGRVLVGTAPATIALVDLDRGAIEDSLQLSADPHEAIHGLALCPPAADRL